MLDKQVLTNSNYQIRVPTNVITGALGVGKTSFITNILSLKPEHERWAILVNEFGEVGIDGGLLGESQQQQVFIKQVPGGCMCCTAGLSMQIALNRLLSQAKPHRLIIEPTGLGHPAEVLATLQAPHYRHLIDVKATLTLVDARKVTDKRWLEQPTFAEQVQVADVILATKSDLYQGNEMAALAHYLDTVNQETGKIRPQFDAKESKNAFSTLDLPCDFQAEYFPKPADPLRSEKPNIEQQLLTNDVVKMVNHGGGFYSFGWAFSPKHVFNFDDALSSLRSINVNRLKAILITDEGIVAFNIVDNEMSYQALNEINDSRLEFICDELIQAEQIASELEQGLFDIKRQQ